ncbi:PREDICTED: ceramide synthase 6-like [Acropora digitifera]|uniref:ceramide synthase 6-like n=1 Tax=Acropora digitifera TaxID=70779 RepID=UPI00077ACF02|nr:PREDICTED: ceramide synthase 6-like [Acropora digitifera]
MTMAAVQEVSEWFWNADFWLPPNSTYDSLEKAKVLTWGKAGELYLSLPLAILLIILRFIFERFIAAPFLNYLGLQDKPSSFVPNTFCEKVFQTISKFPNEERVEGLSKQLGWSKDDVRRWFKSRRQQSRPSLMKKATESSWRFAFYLAVSLYGFFVVFEEPWLWDLKLCFEGHGSHPLTDEIYLYYLVEVGFYLSLKISLFVDVKRKDFWQMVIHHIVTTILLVLSYNTGFFRIGCVIILLHDVSDVFLESSKVLHYAKWDLTTTIGFVLFAVVFYMTRLVYYPFWVLYTVYYSRDYCGPYKAWLSFLILLLCLQVLHIMWAHAIGVVAKMSLTGGSFTGDIRSDEESGPEDEKVEMDNRDGIVQDGKKKQ